MPTQKQIDELYIDLVKRIALESKCKRKKVAAMIVKNNEHIIANGYNGTPPGEDNCCEDAQGKTLSKVIHAEDNALRKLWKSSESSEGTTMYCTLMPCLSCAEKIFMAGIKRVVYYETYRNVESIEYLKSKSIEVVASHGHIPFRFDDEGFL